MAERIIRYLLSIYITVPNYHGTMINFYLLLLYHAYYNYCQIRHFTYFYV